MAQIAIDFLLGTDLSSRMIGWFGFGRGKVEYSHAASVLQDGRYLDARNDTIAGVPPGVHIRDPRTEKWSRKRRATLEVTDAEYRDWEANLRAKISDAYARQDILNFMGVERAHLPGTYICSALAVNAVQHIGRIWTPPKIGYVPFPLLWPAHQISPNMLLAMLEVAGWTISDEAVA